MKEQQTLVTPDIEFSRRIEKASRRLLPVYKRCEGCGGMGFIRGVSDIQTTAGWQECNYTCYKCKGTGKEETEYFIEI
jgi:DnaJ-class molecular chaperone